MKIAISTIISYNYGNRLQNYALQEFLKSLSSDIEVVTLKRNYARNIVLSILKNTIKKLIKRDENSIRYLRLRFHLFNINYICMSEDTVYNSKKNNKLAERYDYFITGSDQVWNPYYGYTTGADFLDYAKKGQRISYAASFGVEEVPESRIEELKDYLENLDHIAVREEQGARIVQKLCDRKAFVVVDPTMLLDRNQWLKMEAEPNWYEGQKFILTYFLGNIEIETENQIQLIEKKYNLTIIPVYSSNSSKKYIHDPSEFIWLIHHAELICTDSFHGTVFSILLNKPFCVFQRTGKEDNTGSRLNTLLCKFGFENRRSGLFDKDDAGLFEMDFSESEKIVIEERKKAKDYLIKALKMDGNNVE